MQSVHGRNERKLILLNNNNQPVGPTNDVVLELSSFLGTLARNATLCPLDILDWRRKKRKVLYHLRSYLWLQEQDTLNVHTKSRMKIPSSKIAEMEEIDKQQSADGSETADPFSSVMGPEHPGRLQLYGRGVTKTFLKRKEVNFEPIINATNDAVQQMQERVQKMEEQRSTIHQYVTANIIAQLQRVGLISADILAALCVPSPGEPTTAPEANHLICRPSTSSNNRGSEGEQRDENNEGTP